MSSPLPEAGVYRADAAVRRELDGLERVALLPAAHMIAVAPPADGREPVYVYVEWEVGQVERPTPGSAIWRAVLDAYLAVDHPEQPHEEFVRAVVQESRARFPSIDAWFRWRDEERRPAPEARAERRPSLRWAMVRWPW